NPAFEETVLHVFVDKSDRQFFTRTKSNRNVPQVRIDPAILPEAFSANIPLARPGRCQAPLGNLPEDRVRSVLDAAAQFRLLKKVGKELCARIVGPLVAAPRPIATIDFAGKDLETELNSSRQSSAASSGGIGNPSSGMAGISSLAGKANRRRDRKVFRRLRSS